MKSAIALSLLVAGLAATSPTVAAAEWQPVEKVQTYSVTGATGAELYASIGARGPKLGIGTRAIAQTSFALTWSRKYENRGDACVLATAKPKLIITYVLPKPANGLPAPLKENWERFISGVREHERVHGDYIVEMVKKIEAATVGLTVPADPNCRKIREEMTRRLGALSQEQRERGRDFDRVELNPGGNVHTLILQLVNGG
ncbi:MAG: DUF922 domain-containing protein [Rhizobium sp.]|nr:DUF922 domain-containing protein [Rhizobium sp.]